MLLTEEADRRHARKAWHHEVQEGSVEIGMQSGHSQSLLAAAGNQNSRFPQALLQESGKPVADNRMIVDDQKFHAADDWPSLNGSARILWS
jgi:hypothetical protein